MSQEALAHAAGLTARTISRIETGKVASPHPVTLERIADALGCDREFLVTGTPADRRRRISEHLDHVGRLMLRAMRDAA